MVSKAKYVLEDTAIEADEAATVEFWMQMAGLSVLNADAVHGGYLLEKAPNIQRNHAGTPKLHDKALLAGVCTTARYSSMRPRAA